jgi:hypothetical protein
MSTEINIWKQLTLDFNKDLHNVLLQQHHAAQFIALVGRHLIPKEADDSNTNMQYLPDREWLIGNELPGGMRIALSLPDLKLIILDKQNHRRSELVLAGKSKKQVFDQLKQNLSDLGLDVSKFTNELHYTLPDHELDKNASFTTGDQKYIQENIFHRHNAEIVLIEIAAKYKKAELVRIWPHHFDTGSFVSLAYNADGGVSKSIGLGWAIPDSMVNEPYYYLSYWSESPVEDFNDLPDPEAGEWIRSGWHGGVVKNTDIVNIPSAEEQLAYVKLFFHSGINILADHYNL